MAVTHYSLRMIDPDQAVIQFYECEFANAPDALDAASRLLSDGMIEVWSDSALIGSVKKSNQSLSVAMGAFRPL